MIMVLILYALLYFAIPYLAFQAVLHWTGSLVASWVAAVVTIPVGVVVYVRLFEYLKHRRTGFGRRRTGESDQKGTDAFS